jgi:Family of unknown function (DUF6282)
VALRPYAFASASFNCFAISPSHPICCPETLPGQIAVDASKASMRALAFKDHWNISCSAAFLAQRHIDFLIEKGEFTHRVEIYGGTGTCFGMNPDAVRAALQYPNFKMIWFATFTSLGFWRGAGQPEKGGVRLVSESGEVLPEVVEIMRMAAAKKVGIGFGHTDFQELLPLAKRAKEFGVRATLDHPLLELNKLLLDEMLELAGLGVYVGTYCQPMIPSLYQPVADPMETIKTIKAIGPSDASSAAISAKFSTWTASMECESSSGRCWRSASRSTRFV